VSGEQGFPKGQYAMSIDGPWAVPTYQALKPVPSYGIATFPAGSAGSFSTVGGEDLVVSAAGKNLTAAEKFAQFLVSPFAQLAMAKDRPVTQNYSKLDAGFTAALQEILAGPLHIIEIAEPDQ
jgi:ABC-type glycerol-3-phosphate transport system substrate-binding protein